MFLDTLKIIATWPPVVLTLGLTIAFYVNRYFNRIMDNEAALRRINNSQ